MQKSALFKTSAFPTNQPLATSACLSPTTKACLTGKDPNPYEMMAMTRQERCDYEKEYNRANRKLLCEIFYTLTFVIRPWRLRRKRRGAFQWERRGKHYEQFRQHRLRRQRRREKLLSATEKENEFHRCCTSTLKKIAEFLKKMCFCN